MPAFGSEIGATEFAYVGTITESSSPAGYTPSLMKIAVTIVNRQAGVALVSRNATITILGG